MRLLLAVTLLALPVAGLVDALFGVEVTVLARLRTPAEREAWRASGWDVRDGVAELYGIVEPPPGLRLVVWDRDRLLHPPEDGTLVLLPVDRAAGEDPLPTRALYLRAGLVALVALLLAAGLHALRRRGARGQPPPRGPALPG